VSEVRDTSLFFAPFCFLIERDKLTSITGKVYLTSFCLSSAGFYSGTTCWICQGGGHGRRMSLIYFIIVFLSPETDISFYPMFFWCYLSVVIINSAKLLIVRVHVSARKPNIIKYPVAGGCYQPQAPTNPPHNALQNPILAKVNYPNHP